MASDLFLLSMLFSTLASIIFFVSLLIRLLKKEKWKEEAKKTLGFLVLTIIFFVLFGLSIT